MIFHVPQMITEKGSGGNGKLTSNDISKKFLLYSFAKLLSFVWDLDKRKRIWPICLTGSSSTGEALPSIRYCPVGLRISDK